MLRQALQETVIHTQFGTGLHHLAFILESRISWWQSGWFYGWKLSQTQLRSWPSLGTVADPASRHSFAVCQSQRPERSCVGRCRSLTGNRKPNGPCEPNVGHCFLSRDKSMGCSGPPVICSQVLSHCPSPRTFLTSARGKHWGGRQEHRERDPGLLTKSGRWMLKGLTLSIKNIRDLICTLS